MKEFDYRRLDRAPERAGKDVPETARRRDVAVDVAESLHRAGAELPVRLAEMRAHSPGKYRQALAALRLGPLGVGRLDAQIALLGAAPDLDIAAELRRRRAASEGLHAGLRARAERALGMGMGHVRVFHGPEADVIARRHGAAAFAWGPNIVLGQGVRNVPSAVMAEEVAHVAQQRGASRGPVSVTPKAAPAERAARGAVSNILAGRRAPVGRVGRRSVMRVERESVSEEDRNPRDLKPQSGSMEARSDDELEKIVNDEKGRPRYVKRGYLYAPEHAGAITLDLWLAAFDELQKRNTGPRGKGDDDKGGGEAHQAMGQSYAPDVAVQRKDTGRPGRGVNVQRVARSGFRGGGQRLPYLTQLQRSFGKHDLAGVRAYVGGSAVVANMRLRARAYAMGENVAFAQSPDLHTVAHEAAHVVQQRQGVDLPGGLSRRGDAYERQADAVAGAVVAGRSAEGLLGDLAFRPTLGVQRDEEERDLVGGSAGRGKQQLTSSIRWDVKIGGKDVSLKIKRTAKRGKAEPKPPGETVKIGVKGGEVGAENEVKAIDQSITNALKAKFASVSLDAILGADNRGDNLRLSAKIAFGDAKISKGGPDLKLATLEVSLKGTIVVPHGEFELAGAGKISLSDLDETVKYVLKHGDELGRFLDKVAPDQRQLDELTAAITKRRQVLFEKFKGNERLIKRDKQLRALVARAGPLKHKLNMAWQKVAPKGQQLRTAIAAVKTKLGEKVARELSQRMAKHLAKLIPGLNIVMTVWDVAEIAAYVIDRAQHLTLTPQFGGVSPEQGNAKATGGRDEITTGAGQGDGEKYESDTDDPTGGTHGSRPGEDDLQGQGELEGKAVDKEGGANELEGKKGQWIHWIHSLNASGGQLRIRVHKAMEQARTKEITALRTGKGSFTVHTEEGPVKFGGKPAEYREEGKYLLIVLNPIKKKGNGSGAGTGGTRTDGGDGAKQGRSYEGAEGRRNNGQAGGANQGRGQGVTAEGAERGGRDEVQVYHPERYRDGNHQPDDSRIRELADRQAEEAGAEEIQPSEGLRPDALDADRVGGGLDRTDNAPVDVARRATVPVVKGDTPGSVAAKAVRRWYPNVSMKRANELVAKLSLDALVSQEVLDGYMETGEDVRLSISEENFKRLDAELGGTPAKK